MATSTSSSGSRIAQRRTVTRQGSLPRVASLPPHNSRSRVTVNSEIEPIEGPEQLEKALRATDLAPDSPNGAEGAADQTPTEQETALGSSAEHRKLSEEHDPEANLSATFHTALQDSRLQMLAVGESVTAIDTKVRTLRSEMLVIRAQTRLSDITQDVRQLRVDYNTEREARRTLKNIISSLESRIQTQDEVLELYRARLERIEESSRYTYSQDEADDEIRSSSESSTDNKESYSDTESSDTSKSEFSSSGSEWYHSDEDRLEPYERNSALFVSLPTPYQAPKLVSSTNSEAFLPNERNFAEYQSYPYENQTDSNDIFGIPWNNHQSYTEQLPAKPVQHQWLTRVRSGTRTNPLPPASETIFFPGNRTADQLEASLRRPWRQPYRPPHLLHKVHFSARQYKVYADFGFRRHRLSRILSALDTVATANFIQKSELPPCTRVLYGPVPEVSDQHGLIDTFGMTELTVHLRHTYSKVRFVICKRLPAPMVLGHDFCARNIEAIYPRTKTIELDDSTTVPIARRPIKRAKGAVPLPPNLEYGKAHGAHPQSFAWWGR